MRTFVFAGEKPYLFWNIELQGQIFTVTSGRVGTTGETDTRAFADGAEAASEHDRLVMEKLAEGYIETTSGAPIQPEPSTEQKALESALVAHPDEIAAHSAYGDYLTEAEDPRGAFVQVQLALEDAGRSKAERDELREREAESLRVYARYWMGAAGRFLVGDWSGPDLPFHFGFVRGWLDYVRMLPAPDELIEALAQSPESRLLRRLDVVYDMRYHPFDYSEFLEKMQAVLTEDEQRDADEYYMDTPENLLPPLAKSPYLTNLRVLKYGFSDDHPRGPSHSTMVNPFARSAAELLDVLKNCPRLEELYLNAEMSPIDSLFSSELLENLRVFQYYYGTNYSDYQNRADPYPLSVLAENKSLKNVHTLRFHPGRDATIDINEFGALLTSKNLPALRHLQVHMTTFGDEGVDRIIASGMLKRLKTLDIGYGNLTDAGAQMLATCPDLKNLDVLDVSQNALTPVGIGALVRAGMRIVADTQHGIGGEDDDAYLYRVDRE